MGKRMFNSLEDQLSFAEQVGLDPSSLNTQDVGIAFGAAQAELVAANKTLPENAFDVIRDEVLGAVPSLNK